MFIYKWENPYRIRLGITGRKIPLYVHGQVIRTPLRRSESARYGGGGTVFVFGPYGTIAFNSSTENFNVKHQTPAIISFSAVCRELDNSVIE